MNEGNTLSKKMPAQQTNSNVQKITDFERGSKTRCWRPWSKNRDLEFYSLISTSLVWCGDFVSVASFSLRHSLALAIRISNQHYVVSVKEGIAASSDSQSCVDATTINSGR